MSCLISTGRKLACKDKVGGLLKVWFANFETITPTLDGTSKYITNLSSGATVYEYELKGVSKLSQEMVSSKDNGTTMITQTLTLDLQGADQITNNQILLLAYGRPQVFVQNNFGDTVFVGRLRGMDVTSAISDYGDTLGSKVGYTITMVGEENFYAEFLSGSTVANAFAGMANAPAIVKGS